MTAVPIASRRIIPARAGFTRELVHGNLGPQDHPRSRGVYPVSDRSGKPGSGSSPLARGLLRKSLPGSPWPRIIPARAGFTARSRARRGGGRDHPRSRGVYPIGGAGAPRSTGSSPLARGLRGGAGRGGAAALDHPRSRGVYRAPARGPDASRDHPRSRGVYKVYGGGVSEKGGSSPLARGLPRAEGRGRLRPRIIPARAGFTPLAR